MTASQTSAGLRGIPAAANPVAIGGWAWTTAFYIRSHSIDLQMHCDFARNPASPSQIVPIHIDYNQVLQAHHTVADRCRRDEKRIAVEPHGQVTVCGGDIAVFVQELSEMDELFSGSDFLPHTPYRSISWAHTGSN